jgi:tetratricopeptide (TPR) repeat protein
MIRPAITLAAVLVLLPVSAFGREYPYASVDPQKLIDDSSVKYEIRKIPNRPQTQRSKLNPLGLYIEEGGKGRLYIRSYEDALGSNDVVASLKKESGDAFQKKDYAAAQASYLKLLQLDPMNSVLMTKIGRCSELTGNIGEATGWYRKAVRSNFYDYLAHMLLAGMLLKEGKGDEAQREAATALVLNRNDSRMRSGLDGVLKRAGKRYAGNDWDPRLVVEGDGTQYVEVSFVDDGINWEPYAVCKAAWLTEEAFRMKMMHDRNDPERLVEEMTCMTYMFRENAGAGRAKPKRGDTVPGSMPASMNDGEMKAFVTFEMVLPEDPAIVFNMNADSVRPVVDYVLSRRVAPLK